eukprot:46069-Pleurochrysis_carterae.AAC.1
MGDLCPTAPPTNLPEEFRWWNREELSQVTQHRSKAAEGGSSGDPHGDATFPNAPQLETRRAEASGGAGDSAENMDGAEPASRAADGPDGDDAAEHPPLAEASDAEGGGGEDDLHANPDNVHSGSPADHAEVSAPADGPGDIPLEDAAQHSGRLAQEHTKELGFKRLTCRVRMCQTPEVCWLLPPEATSAHVLPIRIGPEHDYDVITASALQLMTRSANAEEHAASADQITSRATGLMSDCVAWVEIDDNGRKSVVQVRVLRCVDGKPFATPWLGLTWATYRRMTDGLCPTTTPPMILPPEFRPANQRRLDVIARLIREQDAEEARNVAPGSSGTVAKDDADVTAAASDAAAETAAAAPCTADENADAATAALDVAAEATAAAPGTADENADAATAALSRRGCGGHRRCTWHCRRERRRCHRCIRCCCTLDAPNAAAEGAD